MKFKRSFFIQVDGLKKGQSYQFRVKAVNKEGASDPLTTEKATVAKNPYGTKSSCLLLSVVFFSTDIVL